MVPTRLVTADELWAMPGDGERYELVEGSLRARPLAGAVHGVLSIRLLCAVSGHVGEHELGIVFGGGTGFRISRDPDTVRAPDLAFVRCERVPSEGVPEGYWPGVPDLAVEIVSPVETLVDLEEKVSGWLDAGTRQVWVVNPRRRTLTVHRAEATNAPLVLDRGDVLEGADVLPGFRLDLDDLFVA